MIHAFLERVSKKAEMHILVSRLFHEFITSISSSCKKRMAVESSQPNLFILKNQLKMSDGIMTPVKDNLTNLKILESNMKAVV